MPAAAHSGTCSERWRRPRTTTIRRGVLTAGVAVVLAVLASAGAGDHADWPAFLALALAGTVLALIDAVEQHRLPNKILLAAAGAGVVPQIAAAGIDHRWDDLARVAVGGAAARAAAPRRAGLTPQYRPR